VTFQLEAHGTHHRRGGPALRGDVINYLLANLVPQPTAARGRKRLHLQGRTKLIEVHRDDALGALFNLETEVESFTRLYANRTEIHEGTNARNFAFVERPVEVSILWCALFN
jgi:hypothetical protein